jgi:hypothetical protein
MSNGVHGQSRTGQIHAQYPVAKPEGRPVSEQEKAEAMKKAEALATSAAADRFEAHELQQRTERWGNALGEKFAEDGVLDRYEQSLLTGNTVRGATAAQAEAYHAAREAYAKAIQDAYADGRITPDELKTLNEAYGAVTTEYAKYKKTMTDATEAQMKALNSSFEALDTKLPDKEVGDRQSQALKMGQRAVEDYKAAKARGDTGAMAYHAARIDYALAMYDTLGDGKVTPQELAQLKALESVVNHKRVGYEMGWQ